MTPRDAFELPYLLTEVTIALAARVQVEKHSSPTSALSEAADRLDVEPYFQRIDEILSRAKIATSPRPTNTAELRSWSQAIAAAIPKSEAVAQFGHVIGLLIQNLRLHEFVVPLVKAAPDDIELAMREQYFRELRKTLAANVANQSGLPVELRAMPAQLAKMTQADALRGEVGLIASVLKGELTKPKISLDDAFLSTLQASEVGVPYLGLEFTDVALMTSTPALEQRIVKQQNAYRAIGPQVGALIGEIEARLKRSQLSVPPRPNSYAEWLKWNNAIAHAVGAATGPEQPAGAMAALGRAIGEAMLTLSSLAVVMSLREVDDTNAELVFYQSKFEKTLVADVERLTGMSTFTTLPAAVKPIATSMATVMRMIPNYELAWRRMAELIAEIRSLFV